MKNTYFYARQSTATGMITTQHITELLEQYINTGQKTAGQKASYDNATYIQFHTKRYVESLKFIKPLLPSVKKILELGEPGPFTFLIGRLYPEISIDYVQEDLRYTISKLENSYDLILNMEVIEHIKDHRDASFTEVDFSGLKQFIKESYRVLKPGGKMFITTPNAGSYNMLNLLFNHEPAWMWRYHFREYQPHELSDFLRDAGFSISRMETLHVWPQREDHRYTRIIKFLDSLKKLFHFSSSSTFLRGDEIFLICQK